MPTRRTALALPAAVAGLTALAACGPNAGGEEDGSQLRFAWWGNAARDRMTGEALDLYSEQNDVSIAEEPTDWGGYWDKLATQVAGGDVPDILQMDEGYLAEYSSRGIILDLAETSLDTSGFDASALDAGKVDGGLYAVNAGINAPVLLANPAVFEAAGVELPDDSTWTWDDMVDIAVRISEGTEDGTFGIQQLGVAGDPAMSVFLRQLGAEKFDGDALGFGAGELEQWMELAQRLQDSGAAPGTEVAVEEAGQSVDQTMFATGTLGLQSQWSNQLVTFDEALDGQVVILRMPSREGSADAAQLWYKASMYFAVSASSENAEAAVSLVDWLVTSPDAGRILLAERGVPADLDVREAIADSLSEADAKVVDFIEQIEPELGEAPPITPPGGGSVGDAFQRAMEEVLFGRSDIPSAAQSAIDEAAGLLG